MADQQLTDSAPPPMPDDGLSDDERKFMETRGEAGLPDAPPAPAETAPGMPPPIEPPSAEAGADDDDDGEPAPVDPKTGKQPPRRVNFNKFRKVEERLEASETRNRELSELMSRADERLKIINEALSTPPTGAQEAAADADPMPDPKEDIFAYLAWNQRETQRNFERLATQFNGVQQHVTQTTADQQFMQNYRGDAMRFASQEPKFGEAYSHLINMRAAQLQAAGIADPNRRKAIIEDEERNLVQGAYNDKINPAQRIFELARTYGWSPSAASAAPGASSATPGAPGASAAPAANGRAAPAAPAPAGGANVGAEIDAVKNGQGAALSLSSGHGVPVPNLTPEVLANMSEADFGRLIESLPKDKQRELLGG